MKIQILYEINYACNLLIKNDFYLLEVWINERTLTHRLAVYLEKLFPDYHVDCEYNRNWALPKTISNEFLSERFQSSNADWITAYPDIIIHKRWTNDNFIVIEVKKSKDSRWKKGIEFDIEKLEAYKDNNEYSYKYWFFIMFDLKSKSYQIFTIEEARASFL